MGEERLLLTFLGGMAIPQQAVSDFNVLNIKDGAGLDALSLNFTIDVFVGDFHHWAIDFEAFGFWQFKIWDLFDLKFEGEVFAIFDFQFGHGADGHRVTNRPQAVTTNRFLESFLDQSVSGFFAKLTTKAFFQQLGRGVPTSEAREGGIGCQIAQRVTEA